MSKGLRIIGIERFKRRVANLERRTIRAATDACVEGAEYIRDVMQNQFLNGSWTIGRVTGHLRDNWNIRAELAKATLWTDTIYSHAHEYGFKRVQSVYSKKHKRWYVRKQNIKPKKFLRGAIKRSRPKLPEIMSARFRRSLFGF